MPSIQQKSQNRSKDYLDLNRAEIKYKINFLKVKNRNRFISIFLSGKDSNLQKKNTLPVPRFQEQQVASGFYGL